MDELLRVINSDKAYETYQACLNEIILLNQNFKQALTEVKTLIENPIFVPVDLSKDYSELEEDKKMQVALEMLNNPSFQKNCCKILMDEYKQVVESDSTMKLVDNLLGFSKYLEKAIKTGIGCNHKYEEGK